MSEGHQEGRHAQVPAVEQQRQEPAVQARQGPMHRTMFSIRKAQVPRARRMRMTSLMAWMPDQASLPAR